MLYLIIKYKKIIYIKLVTLLKRTTLHLAAVAHAYEIIFEADNQKICLI